MKENCGIKMSRNFFSRDPRRFCASVKEKVKDVKEKREIRKEKGKKFKRLEKKTER